MYFIGKEALNKVFGMKCRWLTLLVMALLSLTIFAQLPAPSSAAPGDIDQEPNPTPRILQTVNIYVNVDGELTPEVPDERQTDPQVRGIPSKYTRTGLFGLGILPFIQMEWAIVGKFESKPLRQPMYMGGRITFVMWAKTNTGSATSDFRFTLFREGEELVRVDVQDQNIASEPVRITAVGSLGQQNDTFMPAGTRLILQIEARTQYDNAVMLYGTSRYNTGFTFNANPLDILTATMSKKSVSMEYTDAFNVPVNRMFYQCLIDGYILSAHRIETEMNTTSFAWKVNWIYPMDPGDHHVEIRVGYDPSGAGNVTEFFDLTLRIVKESRFVKFVRTNSTSIIGVLILLIIAYVFYTKRIKPKRTAALGEREIRPKRKLTRAEKRELKRERKLKKKARKLRKKGKLPADVELGL